MVVGRNKAEVSLKLNILDCTVLKRKKPYLPYLVHTTFRLPYYSNRNFLEVCGKGDDV